MCRGGFTPGKKINPCSQHMNTRRSPCLSSGGWRLRGVAWVGWGQQGAGGWSWRELGRRRSQQALGQSGCDDSPSSHPSALRPAVWSLRSWRWRWARLAPTGFPGPSRCSTLCPQPTSQETVGFLSGDTALRTCGFGLPEASRRIQQSWGLPSCHAPFRMRHLG